MTKTGVLLINLGTPDSPGYWDVRKYLTEFLNDPRVIDLPWLGRKLLVNGIIIPFRTHKSAGIYRELWKHGNGVSPLLTYGNEVKELLQNRLGSVAEVELAMRYGKPSLNEVLRRMQKKHYERIIILPLFPQYSSAANGSAIEKAMKLISKWWVIPDIRIVSQFYDHPKFIETVVERAKQYDINEYDHIIFSYHGLPDRHVDKVYEDRKCANHSCESEINHENAFCYKATCYATTRSVVEALGLKEGSYTTSFQSRLDKKWLTPFSDEVVEKLAKEGAKKILVFSPAFVADCLETIIEIGEEYQEIFEEHGGEKVQLVESCNSHPLFVDCLEDLVRSNL
jgi:protoporphyrin/coproporphyrin ferrochelatase